MSVALPDQGRIGPPSGVRVTERLRDLERICARGDHQRGERVPKVVELKPSEFFLSAWSGLQTPRA